MKCRFFILLFLLPFLSSAQTEKIRLFYLGGQSNMDGYGFVKDLPEELNKTFENVFIYQGNPAGDGDKNGGIGTWEKLRPGHGVGFKSDGKANTYSDRFGLELSFALKLQEMFPGEKFAIIKYSKGGSSIDSLAAGMFGSWEPDFKGEAGINQWDHYLTTLNGAFSTSDIDGNGIADELIPSGILWMQGESDAVFTREIAERYYFNLKRLMDMMRASFRTDDLPVVIGKISDSQTGPTGKVWKFGELVQHAQEEYIRNDPNAIIVRSTKYYKYSDPWHYDSKGYIDLGEQMAEALSNLVQVKK